MLNKEVKDLKILVFSSEKISDPAIDLAGMLKLDYPPQAYVVNVPCSSAIKPRWIMHAFHKGYDGVFIAADGSDCPYDISCSEKTAKIVGDTQALMKAEGIDPARLKMAAICSVCAEAFVRHVRNLLESLVQMQKQSVN